MVIGPQLLLTMKRLVCATADLLEGKNVESVERLILVVLIIGQPEYKALVGLRDRQGAEHPIPDSQGQTEILVQMLFGDTMVQLMVVRTNQNGADEPAV